MPVVHDPTVFLLLSWRQCVGWDFYSTLLALAAHCGVFGVCINRWWSGHGPGLLFWMENMPWLKTLELLFKGDGNCAEVHWRFLGLSIAEWSLAWFVLFCIIALRVLFARKRPVSE